MTVGQYMLWSLSTLISCSGFCTETIAMLCTLTRPWHVRVVSCLDLTLRMLHILTRAISSRERLVGSYTMYIHHVPYGSINSTITSKFSTSTSNWDLNSKNIHTHEHSITIQSYIVRTSKSSMHWILLTYMYWSYSGGYIHEWMGSL